MITFYIFVKKNFCLFYHGKNGITKYPKAVCH